MLELEEKRADGVVDGELQVHGRSIFGEMIDAVWLGFEGVSRLFALRVETLLR